MSLFNSTLFSSNVIIAPAPRKDTPGPSPGYPPRGEASPSPILGGLGLRLTEMVWEPENANFHPTFSAHVSFLLNLLLKT